MREWSTPGVRYYQRDMLTSEGGFDRHTGILVFGQTWQLILAYVHHLDDPLALSSEGEQDW